MKVLTIKQPYATLIMLGHKKYEFRSWKTNFRGELLIHAGQSIDKDAVKRTQEFLPEELPQGKILGKVKITDCIKCNKNLKDECMKQNPLVYAKSPVDEGYAWKIEDVEVWDKQIEIKGKLGLWNYTEGENDV